MWFNYAKCNVEHPGDWLNNWHKISHGKQLRLTKKGRKLTFTFPDEFNDLFQRWFKDWYPIDSDQNLSFFHTCYIRSTSWNDREIKSNEVRTITRDGWLDVIQASVIHHSGDWWSINYKMIQILRAVSSAWTRIRLQCTHLFELRIKQHSKRKLLGCNFSSHLQWIHLFTASHNFHVSWGKQW